MARLARVEVFAADEIAIVQVEFSVFSFQCSVDGDTTSRNTA